MIWDVTAKTTMLQTPYFRVTAAVLERAGATAQTRYLVESADCVVIVARGGDGRLLLVNVTRPTAGGVGWELPAGSIETGEEPEAAARRELSEEAGHTADTLKHLGAFYPSNRSLTARVHVYLADHAQSSEPVQEESVQWFSVAQVLDMLTTGGITDGVSIAALTYAFKDQLLK